MAIFDSLGKYRNTGLLIMRIGIGIMFIVHGFPKLAGGPAGWAELGGSMKVVGVNFLPVFWGFMAAVAETFGGFLLIVGLFFRPACIALVFTMIIAALVHFGKGDGLGGASHAIELGIVFFSLIFIGPGKYSVDKK
ncbi:DoxX family protein [Agrobacterium tumefaciens]|uniref:Putative oxidoreductase n=1 Tax=Pedobacter psychrotolerans TaxID=1843235 RepID=A0A4R2HFA8_9SPHI|nr:DoxX family protein [Pedobacter psychrotolerans]NTE05164.1 DoxX family protein [Agrobacterium tumefaciens]NTE26928.1 DoxX family protein [Agrobacterium tumefaciens]TCO27060.1 putative oxidoreductase [Pedobacter psychrotolerans]GGE58609.1 quinol oxidase [Pedobacter psychrotolerans]